jgi:hypothetical protein
MSPSPTPLSFNSMESPKKRFPTWLKVLAIILGVLIVLIVAGIMIALKATAAPQKVSDQFVNDVQANDATAAYALTSDSFKKVTTQAQLTDVVAQVSPTLKGDEKVSGRAVYKYSGTPQTAVLVYSVKTSDGTMYIKTELQKSGDTWQVINFHSSKTPLSNAVE